LFQYLLGLLSHPIGGAELYLVRHARLNISAPLAIPRVRGRHEEEVPTPQAGNYADLQAGEHTGYA
jgi:hypothetical protein